MSNPTRRDFLKTAAAMAALLGLGPGLVPKVAQAMEELVSGLAPVLWLQGQSCSGCSVSFLNSEAPGPAAILTGYLSLLFHSTLSATTGEACLKIINRAAGSGGHFLVVEGAMPAGMPRACLMGHQPVTEQVLRAAEKAKAVVAVGSCAAVGGIPAAENNPTGAVSVPEFLKRNKLEVPVISLPGCPAHPDWTVGTIIHALKFGLPELDELGRPKVFYGRLVHEQCPRFADYERKYFAKSFTDPGCLFKLGCLGPVTKADCTLRKWNGGTNTCIMAGAPCIGCAAETFARSAAVPFYRRREVEEASSSS